jgi:methionyl-tRNA formyltransferase
VNSRPYPEILMIGKRGESTAEAAAEKLCAMIPGTTVLMARRGDPWPQEIDSWEGDYLLSYLAPFVFPARVLEKARKAAINFHPGPPEYPGIGCTNFALYNEEPIFGVTCHHMTAAVDSGSVIEVRRFPVMEEDTVLSITRRCYEEIATLFDKILKHIRDGAPLPAAEEHWTRAPYLRRELDALCRITVDMPADEVRRRVRAVTFPGAPGAFLTLHGYRFEFREDGKV